MNTIPHFPPDRSESFSNDGHQTLTSPNTVNFHGCDHPKTIQKPDFFILLPFTPIYYSCIWQTLSFYTDKANPDASSATDSGLQMFCSSRTFNKKHILVSFQCPYTSSPFVFGLILVITAKPLCDLAPEYISDFLSPTYALQLKILGQKLADCTKGPI